MANRALRLAKLTRPKSAAILERPRLTARLDSAARSVAWVTGPPGSGKTTLAASYAQNCPAHCLWYQMDGGDSDVATFFHYLSHAVRGRERGEDQPLPVLLPEYFSELEIFSRRYFRAMFAQLGRRFLIVFDNYHEVAPPSPVHEAMRCALEELPSEGQIVFVSRLDPPVQMARWRVNQAMEVIDAADLRLTEEEVAEVARTRGHSLSAQAVTALWQRTEGWAAGVVLMLAHAKSVGAMTPASLPSTPEVVFDYFAGEIFQSFEPATREFLLRVAFLPRITAKLARALTGEEEAQAILQTLARHGEFVTESSTGRDADYQLHPLLREFLLRRAEDSFDADTIVELRARAASALRRGGDLEAAVELLVENGDWTQLAEIMSRFANVALDQRRYETLAHWLEAFPDEVLAANPWMSYWLGAARFHAAPREGRRSYERAFQAFRTADPPDTKGLILSACGVVDTILFESEDLSLLDRWFPVLEDALAARDDGLGEDVEARVTTSLFMSMVLRRPEHPRLGEWIDRAYRFSRSQTSSALRMSIEPLVAVSVMWTGRFSRAQEVIESMRELARETELTPLALTTLKVVESMYYMLLGDAKGCTEAVAEGLKVSREHGVRLWGKQLLANGAGALLGAGDLTAAEQRLREMQSDGPGRRVDDYFFHYFRAWHQMLKGDVLGAYQHQKRALAAAVDVGVPFLEVLSRLGLAQALYACDDERKGEVQLRKVHAMARGVRNHLLEYMALTTYAHIAIQRGKRRSGLNSLRYAMALGREHDYSHFCWWQPSVMAELCALALEEGIEEDYVRRLVRARDLFPAQSPLHLASWPWRFKLRTLGGFQVTEDDAPRTFAAKAPVRPFTLLKVLVALGGREVRADQLAEAIWPHVDGDYAHRSFTTNLHRLRKLLGSDRAVLLHEGRVSLDERSVWLDVWALQSVLAEVDPLLRELGRDLDVLAVERLERRLLDLYRGPFLADDSEQAVYLGLREQLRGRFSRALAKLTGHWKKSADWERVADSYERAVEADEQCETFYRQLMIAYASLDRPAEVVATYERWSATLAAVHDATPSREMTTLYQRAIRAR